MSTNHNETTCQTTRLSLVHRATVRLSISKKCLTFATSYSKQTTTQYMYDTVSYCYEIIYHKTIILHRIIPLSLKRVASSSNKDEMTYLSFVSTIHRATVRLSIVPLYHYISPVVCFSTLVRSCLFVLTVYFQVFSSYVNVQRRLNFDILLLFLLTVVFF